MREALLSTHTTPNLGPPLLDSGDEVTRALQKKDSLSQTAEHQRLAEYRERTSNWKHWGPYLSERAWGTLREDYSEQGAAWEYLPHDHAHSRV